MSDPVLECLDNHQLSCKFWDCKPCTCGAKEAETYYLHVIAERFQQEVLLHKISENCTRLERIIGEQKETIVALTKSLRSQNEYLDKLDDKIEDLKHLIEIIRNFYPDVENINCWNSIMGSKS